GEPRTSSRRTRMTTTVDQVATPARSAERRMREIIDTVAPSLRATRAESEAARRLAPASIRALLDAGVLRALVPAKYHGAELGPVHGIQLFEELAYVDSAAAWVASINAAGSWLMSLLPERAADEVL